jgi:WD40 repeat protein
MHSERRPKPDRSPESLEARLRALPRPHVPAGLEARLLATIPADRPIPRRRRAAWIGAVGTLAAACLLAVLVWPRRSGKVPVPSPGTSESLQQRHFALEQAKSPAESNRLLAIRNFDRGQAAFEKGEIGPGMLWMIESWRSAIAAGDPAWQHAARANLAYWRPHYRPLKAVLSRTSPIVHAAFSPDSRTVITASMDGTAQLWDAASGKRIGPSLQAGGHEPYVAFSPDGKTVWTVSEGDAARLWDAASGLPHSLPLRRRLHTHILAVAMQPNGRIILIGTENDSDNIARLWDAASGETIGLPLKHPSRVSRVVKSPDGRVILTTCAYDRTPRLWDAATGKPLGPAMHHESEVRAVAFSPDGMAVLTGARDGAARLWDAATGKPLGPPMRQESGVRAVAFSPDGKTLLTGYQEKESRLWDAATAQLIGVLEHQTSVMEVAFSPDGTTLLLRSLDGTVRLWDGDPGRPVGQILEVPTTDRVVDWNPQRKLVVTLPQEPNHQRYVRLWDGTTGKPIGARLPQPGGNEWVSFNTDGKVVLTTEADQMARLWDATTGLPIGPAFALPSKVLAAGLAPDGERFWFTGEDNSIWLCDGVTGTVRGHTPALRRPTYCTAFSPDCKTFFTGLDDGEVQLWDAATLAPRGEPFVTRGVVSDATFSGDGKLALICHEDGSAWLWDLSSRKPLIPPLRHLGPLVGSFSPDGKTIVTSSNDKTARVWDAATGQPIGPILRRPDAGKRAAFIAGGRTLFIGGPAAHLFPVPPDLPDELERIATWIEVITGLRLDEQRDLIQVLDNAAWLERRERLMQLGGPPEIWPEHRLDSILFGPDPAARARSFMKRQQWDAAEAAFDEAMRARPFNISIVLERGDLYAHRGLWSDAAAYFATKVEQYPEVAPLHEQLAVTRLLAGDRPGYRAACAGMLDRFKPIDDSTAATAVTNACTLAANAVSDLPGLVEVSKRSTRWVASNERGVGAVLFRAGRLEEALECFEQGHRVFEPRAWDWLFLAMIHSRLGHASEARRSLQQADQWIVAADKAPSATQAEGPLWSSLVEKPTILLLRSEAEAVVRFDPFFPADPFAR